MKDFLSTSENSSVRGSCSIASGYEHNSTIVINLDNVCYLQWPIKQQAKQYIGVTYHL